MLLLRLKHFEIPILPKWDKYACANRPHNWVLVFLVRRCNVGVNVRVEAATKSLFLP